MKQKSLLLDTVEEIVNCFKIEGEIKEISCYGFGHINDTYLVKNTVDEVPDYLLQRMNHQVFNNIEGIINNICTVTNHLKNKIQSESTSTNNYEQVLNLIPTFDENYYVKDSNGNFWRMYNFVEGSVSYNLPTSNQQVFKAGQAFGQFQKRLADLNPTLLVETIPDFHNLNFRLQQLDEVLLKNKANRSNAITEEIDLIRENQERMLSIYRLGEAGLLPQRILHNDTKFNNILFDQHNRVVSIIDLDTVMPGYVAYDYGDAIRTLANTAEEDEPDLGKIDVNMEILKAFTQGFSSETKSFLTAEEVNSLGFSVLLFPFMQGVRFLTDYLNGDVYYKIKYPTHNYVRAKSQLQLFKQLLKREVEIVEIIDKEFETQNFVNIT